MAHLDRSRLSWHKSSYSSDQPDCVEVAFAGDLVASRDSKDPDGAMLVFPTARWADFLHTLPTPHLRR